MSELDAKARKALRDMEVPKRRSSLYPAIHKAAYSIEGYSNGEVIGAVFKELCKATGATYGSQYMGNVINARFDDGTLPGLLKGLPV